MRVKQRLSQVIDALAEGSLFNVIVFADAGSAMEKKMVVANNSNRKKAKMFLRPYNTEGNWGHNSGNLGSCPIGVRAVGGTTRLDIALSAAVIQGADTILIISDGIPRVRKGVSQEQVRAHNERLKQWNMENAAKVAAWQQNFAAAQANVQTSSSKVWVPARPAVPARVIPARPPSKRPPKEGQPIDRGSPRRVIPAQPARPGYWKVVTHSSGGYSGPPRPKAPKMKDPGWWTLADFVRHLTILHEKHNKKKGRKPPQIHCIGYQIDKEGNAFLRGLARQYHGKYRRVKQIR
jgi:hypothetical protein